MTYFDFCLNVITEMVMMINMMFIRVRLINVDNDEVDVGDN